ncbi:DNA-binding protein [Thauera sp. SDU_THAU2]|uniref:DNA-binding protein n=1 Tax=Thauera sp. SDU_THAU2 TaxID=3136633 RepID=UPI00311F3ADA
MNLHVITRPRNLDTAEWASALRVKPDTVRRALCLKGHYMGVVPIKLPNGRLLWPADALDRLTAPRKVGGKQ